MRGRGRAAGASDSVRQAQALTHRWSDRRRKTELKRREWRAAAPGDDVTHARGGVCPRAAGPRSRRSHCAPSVLPRRVPCDVYGERERAAHVGGVAVTDRWSASVSASTAQHSFPSSRLHPHLSPLPPTPAAMLPALLLSPTLLLPLLAVLGLGPAPRAMCSSAEGATPTTRSCRRARSSSRPTATR